MKNLEIKKKKETNKKFELYNNKKTFDARIMTKLFEKRAQISYIFIAFLSNYLIKKIN